MPNLKILQWNIESFSDNKSSISAGTPSPLVDNLAKVIHSQLPDIIIIVELKTANTDAIMTRLKTALQNLAGNHFYTNFFYSETTGTDRYGFMIRDVAKVRPLSSNVANDAANPMRDMSGVNFVPDLMPLPLFNADGLPLGNRAAFLLDLHANSFKGTRPANFAGQTTANGGFALGLGYRLPCLAMFEVRDGGGAAVATVPIVVCHYGAKRQRYSDNALANGQIRVLKYLHIAQLYATGGNISVSGAARAVRNLVFTGDFNVDFLFSYPANNGKGSSIVQKAEMAYKNLTDKQRQQGSDVNVQGNAPGATANAGNPPNLFNPRLKDLKLIPALTNEATILHHYHPGPPPFANTQQMKTSCFDNFFFGGVELRAGNVQMLGPALPPAPPPLDAPNSVPIPPPPVGGVQRDCGRVVDVPAMIVQRPPGAGAGAANQLNLKNVADYYWNQYKDEPIYAPVAAGGNKVRKTIVGYNRIWGKKNARDAGRLRKVAGGVAGPLQLNDRLIGARMLSDHLPVLIEFNI